MIAMPRKPRVKIIIIRFTGPMGINKGGANGNNENVTRLADINISFLYSGSLYFVFFYI